MIVKLKAKIMKEVIIDGKPYPADSKYITQDYISGQYILTSKAINVLTSINLLRDTGYDGEGTIKLMSIAEVPRYLREGLIKVLITRFGDIYIIPNVAIRGRGILHESRNADTAHFMYDDYTHPRQNVANKFRAFDNIVKAFRDIDNRLIPQEDRRMLMKRNFEYGVDSTTYKILGGFGYTFGVELETNSGRLSQDDVIGLNLRCEFDGSLRDNPDQRKEDVLGKRKKS